MKKENKELDQKYLNEIKNIEFQPVFIMGVQRSGTSILYKLLSKTNSFNIVTAYHTIKNQELIHNFLEKKEEKIKKELDDFFKNKAQTDRGIDRLKITSDFPEEYGFILAQKTGRSDLSQDSLKIFTDFCKKIQYISNSDKPLLLKNPFDFSNFIFIKEKMPNAKFIFIHRNPIKTLNSQIKAMKTLLKNKSEYMAMLSADYSRVFDNKILLNYYRFIHSSFLPIRSNQVITQLTNRTDYFIKNIKTINNKDYVSIRYEDLCENPNEEIKKIMHFLKINFLTKIDLKAFIKPRKTVILKELKIREDYIMEKMEKYLKYCGYI
jgi:hypothetical protein